LLKLKIQAVASKQVQAMPFLDRALLLLLLAKGASMHLHMLLL
jgi:hypothetical protein